MEATMKNPLYPEYGPEQCCDGVMDHRQNCPLLVPASELAQEMRRRWEASIRPAGVPVKNTRVRCGNCKKQYEVPIEQPWRYMAVQQHKFACPAGSSEAVAAQHEQLVKEFEAQGRQSKKPARRWFQVWRWFE
jgi:hypothetical protein